MSAHASPNIITDGLAFMYDTGSGKSYRGEPTINYIHHQNAVAKDSYSAYSATSSGTYNAKHPNAIIAYNAAGTQMSGYYNGGVGDATNTYHAHWQYDPILKKPVVVMNDIDGQWKAKWLGTSMGSWSSYGKGHGDTYTISWLQWVDNLSKHAKAGLYRRRASDNANNFWDGQANSASSYNTKLRTWQRVYHTFTTSSVVDLNSTYLSIYMYGHYSPRATVKVADVQFTWGSHPAQFSAEYERTATQGLLDLTGNRTIDLSNVSFDSDAQITFDGADDFIALVDNPQNGENSVSWEFITKFDLVHDNETSTYRQLYIQESSVWIGQYYDYIGIDIAKDNGSWFDGNGGMSTSSKIGPVNSGQYYHVVFTWDGTNVKGYLNGELGFTTAISGLTGIRNGQSPRRIGRRSGNPLIGEMPVVKLYNQSLTAAEVLQNYNATKSRFEL